MLITNETRVEALREVAQKYDVPLSSHALSLDTATMMTAELAPDGELPQQFAALEMVAHAAQVRGHLTLAGEMTDPAQVTQALKWIEFSTTAAFVAGANTHRYLDHLLLAAFHDFLGAPDRANGQLQAAATAARAAGVPVTWSDYPTLAFDSDERREAMLGLEGVADYVYNVNAQFAQQSEPAPEPEPESAPEPIPAPEPEPEAPPVDKHSATDHREKIDGEIRYLAAHPMKTHRYGEAAALLQSIQQDEDPAWVISRLGNLGFVLSQTPDNYATGLMAYEALKEKAYGLDDAAFAEACANIATLLRHPGPEKDLRRAYSIAAEGYQVAQISHELSTRAKSSLVLALLYLDAELPDKAVQTINEVFERFPESSITSDDEAELYAQLYAVVARGWADYAHKAQDRALMEYSNEAVRRSHSLFNQIGQPAGFDATRQRYQF